MFAKITKGNSWHTFIAEISCPSWSTSSVTPTGHVIARIAITTVSTAYPFTFYSVSPYGTFSQSKVYHISLFNRDSLRQIKIERHCLMLMGFMSSYVIISNTETPDWKKKCGQTFILNLLYCLHNKLVAWGITQNIASNEFRIGP